MNSIVMQECINFEVIVIDDCSKENILDKVKDLFLCHAFSNYKLIAHEKHLGTVKTCLEAAQESRAEYVRGIGQGYMFFDKYALRDSYNYIISTNAEVTVSKSVYYRALSNHVELIAHQHFPHNIAAYNDPDCLRESYLIQDDRASGINIMYRRDIFIQYLKEIIEGEVKYTEDFVMKCMVFDKRRIYFFDRIVVYYEFGVGISTVEKDTENPYRTSEIFKAMLLDIVNVDNILLKRCKAYPSEFSERLTALINSNRAEIDCRHKLKEKFGIIAIPLILVRRLINRIKRMLRCENFGNPTKTNILSDTDVSTDFANLCMTRE